MKINNLEQLANLSGCTTELNCVITGACVDSRLFSHGNVFFALKGAQVDGHVFLGDVAQKGAKAAVVSKDYAGADFGMQLLRVNDVLQCLQKIAKKIIALRKPKIIAVTGSVGKTTTKDFLTTLLKAKFCVSSSPGNSNSQVGIPLTILNHTTGDEEILVLEMGMTHSGNIAALVEIATPDIALITTTALVHACNFNSLSDIGKAKAEIFSHPNTRLGILNRDIINFEELTNIGACSKLTFSLTSRQADYSLDLSNGFAIWEGGKCWQMDPLNIPGKHNYHNFLAAAAVARNMGLSWEEIESAVPHLQLPERRLQTIVRNGVTFINDSYNASEVSVKAALESLPEPIQGGRKIAALGEMLELGSFSRHCHVEVGDYALQHVDYMFCLGKECLAIQETWERAGKPVIWSMERRDLSIALLELVRPGDVVLLKGSRSKGMWKILEELDEIEGICKA
jgi:UDP-N-acetylmuramoyl-tripeptide--D-alanyl-D-alanine ligase